MVSELHIAAAQSTGRVIEGKKEEAIDVPEGVDLFILECSDCTINAPGKRNNLTIDGCKSTLVQAGSVEVALEISNSEAVKVILLRCRTITVDNSIKVKLTRKSPSATKLKGKQPASPELRAAKDMENPAEDETSAIRISTSGSEDVSINFEGLLPDGSSVGTHHVPKDSQVESGNAPRSVSRITFDCVGIASLTTVACDQYGTPLQALGPSSAATSPAEGVGAKSDGPKPLNESASSVGAESGSVADLLDVTEMLEAKEQAEIPGLVVQSLGMLKESNVFDLERPTLHSSEALSVVAEAGNVAELKELTGMLESPSGTDSTTGGKPASDSKWSNTSESSA